MNLSQKRCGSAISGGVSTKTRAVARTAGAASVRCKITMGALSRERDRLPGRPFLVGARTHTLYPISLVTMVSREMRRRHILPSWACTADSPYCTSQLKELLRRERQREENPGMKLGALADLLNRNRPRLQRFQVAWWDGRPRVTRNFELAVDDVRIGALEALVHRFTA